jgi:hypothetical protein
MIRHELSFPEWSMVTRVRAFRRSSAPAACTAKQILTLPHALVESFPTTIAHRPDEERRDAIVFTGFVSQNWGGLQSSSRLIIKVLVPLSLVNGRFFCGFYSLQESGILTRRSSIHHSRQESLFGRRPIDATGRYRWEAAHCSGELEVDRAGLRKDDAG